MTREYERMLPFNQIGEFTSELTLGNPVAESVRQDSGVTEAPLMGMPFCNCSA